MITPNFARGSIDDSSVIEISSSDDEEEVVDLTSSADELHKKTPKTLCIPKEHLSTKLPVTRFLFLPLLMTNVLSLVIHYAINFERCDL